MYSANAWPYVRAELKPNHASVPALAQRTIDLGFDSFDLMVGPDSTPNLTLDDAESIITQTRQQIGNRISSIVYVGLGMHNMGEVDAMLQAAPKLCAAAGTKCLNLLPRKMGITQQEGFKRFTQLWKNHGETLAIHGLNVAAENHALPCSADDDIFLIRTSDDFRRILDITSSKVGMKYDPAWLMMAGENDVIRPLNDLLPHLSVLDLKDFSKGRFVEPGTGNVPFDELSQAVADHIDNIAVEVEQHHFPVDGEAEITNAIAIDTLQTSSLSFYRSIFH